MRALRHVPFLPVLCGVVLAGCGDEDIGQIQNAAPVAVASGGGTAQRGVAVTFDGSGSTDVDGEIAAYAWDFGGGVTGSGVTASHAFNAAGTFTVTLTVTDDGGLSGTDTVLVVVGDNASPTAVIAAPATGAPAQSLRFDGTGSTDSDGQVTSHTWNFGDGTTGTGPVFDKAYAAAGTFTVTLTVTDDKGASDSAEHIVVVPDAPASVSGSWSWFLTDESLRDLGGACGSFQDSQLTIVQNGTALTITEQAGGVSVAYNGTITGTTFSVENGTFAIQRIRGTFTSPTAFEGFYEIESFITCAPRPVEGVKQ